MSDPTVSVVIPAFRNAATIERTVRSVLAQTYTDLEVVIADQASPDGTWELLQQYAGDPRVRLLQTPADGGAEANWNAVTASARGRYLKLLPADDLLRPTCLERQVASLETHPNAVLAAVRRDLIDPADRVLLAGRGLTGLSGEVAGEQVIRALVRAGTNLLGEPGCVLLRTDALRQAGGWDGTYPYLIDQVSYMNVLRLGSLVADDAVEASFRISNTQWSVRLARQQARQAAAAHHHFRTTCPDIVSARDERRGFRRAVATSLMRRVAYLAWRRRLR
jgi:glycosyltransferase involved in cell wall biosynthesis